MIKLTTIIANYNYAHFLKEAVLSIVKQKGPHELLIVDDASTDGSRDLILQLSQTYSNVRYHFKAENEGVEEAFNTGLKLAQGEYVHLFASDDLYLPHSLDVIYDHINRFPDVHFFCSDLAFFTCPSDIQVKRQLPDSNGFSFFSPQEVFKLFQTTDFWIPGHTIIAKKRIYLKYAPQNKNLRFTADWFINHTMALEEGVGYIPQGLMAMRKHGQNYSSASSESRRTAFLNLLELLEKDQPKFALFYKSGIMRMLGLRAIYKDLLKNPRYWKYVFPMIKRELLKKRTLSTQK